MFANLKIRTGLMLVLGLFSLALWSVLFMSWTHARQAAHALDDVIALSSGQIEPLHDTERLLLSTLVNMDSAYINLQRGDQVVATDYTRKASAALKEAANAFAQYRKTAGNDSYAKRAEQAYADYARVLGVREEALYEVSLDQYVAASSTAEKADAAFADTLRGVIRRAEITRDTVRKDSGRRYELASTLAAALFVLSIVLVGLYWFFFERVLLRPLRAAGQQFDRIAAGDLTARIDNVSGNEIGVLLAALQRMQHSLADTVGVIRRGTDDVNRNAQEIADGNIELSGRTEEQGAALEETAATLEQLAGAVRQNADNTEQTSRLAKEAAGDAERGGELVGTIVETMAQVSHSAHRISDIVSVIDGIAFQTNILALNAAVEAARAGVQGRGFAVVAAEVRSLALRSAEAAKEVKTLIDQSARHVELGSTQVAEARQAMQQIVGSVRTVTDTMKEIAVATSEQSAGIEQVSQTMSQMDRSTQQNAALVEQTAAAAGALKSQAACLVEAVSVFSLPQPTTTLAIAGDQSVRRISSDADERVPGTGWLLQP